MKTPDAQDAIPPPNRNCLGLTGSLTSLNRKMKNGKTATTKCCIDEAMCDCVLFLSLSLSPSLPFCVSVVSAGSLPPLSPSSMTLTKASGRGGRG